MNRTALISTLLGLFSAGVPDLAGLITIEHTDRGWYDSSGLHVATSENILTGSLESVNPFTNTLEFASYRSWFVFDLSGISDEVISAQIVLEQPNEGFKGSPGVFSLFDVTSDLSFIRDGGVGKISAFEDLGTGVLYGDATIDSSSNGSRVSISLNTDAINAINASEGLFAMGGQYSLESAQSDNYTFARSSTSSIFQSYLELEALDVTPVPEPRTTTAFVLGAAAFLVGYRRFMARGRARRDR
jgi:hypothetical protein